MALQLICMIAKPGMAEGAAGAGVHADGKPHVAVCNAVACTVEPGAADARAGGLPLATFAASARKPRSRLEPVSQTDGVAPREAACDAVFRAVSAAGAEDPIIFNCQMGAGRTTTGMVIACLVRTFTTGAPGPRVCMVFHRLPRAHAHDRPAMPQGLIAFHRLPRAHVHDRRARPQGSLARRILAPCRGQLSVCMLHARTSA